MDQSAYIDHFRRDATRFATAAPPGLETPVPSCPGWSLDVLLGHLTMVIRFQTAALREMPTDGPPVVDLNMRSEGRVEAFEQAAADMTGAMEAADPAAAVWTWSHDHTARFWIRRITQETAVHRWDAEHAVGEPTDVATDLAVDGIDELLGVFLPAGTLPLMAPDGTVVRRDQPSTNRDADDGRSLHIHTTDAEGEWVVRFEPARVNVEAGHAKADLAMRGPSSDVLLALWGRAPRRAVELLGDESVFDLWKAAVSLN